MRASGYLAGKKLESVASPNSARHSKISRESVAARQRATLVRKRRGTAVASGYHEVSLHQHQ